MSTPQRTVTGIVEELHQVASVLAGLTGELPPELYCALTLGVDEGTDDDTAIGVVDTLSASLLGRKAVTSGDYHAIHGSRGPLFVSIQAKLVGPHRAREAALVAEVARLRAELAKVQPSTVDGGPS